MPLTVLTLPQSPGTMSLSAHLKGGKQLLQAAPEWAKVTDRVISVLGLNPGTVSEPWLAYSVMLFLNNNLYIYFSSLSVSLPQA